LRIATLRTVMQRKAFRRTHAKGFGVFMRKQRCRFYGSRSARRRPFSPLVLVGVLVPVVLTIIVGAVFVVPRLASHAAAAVHGDCALIVPPHPLTAQGLATPCQ